MKASEIKEMAPEERVQKLNDMKEELFNLRFQHEVGQLENSSTLKSLKRDIARIKTIMNASETQN